MKKIFSILAITAIVGLCNVSVAVDEAKSADIRSLLEISGELESLRKGMTLVLDQIKSSGANMPDAYFGEFESALATDELPSMLVKIYDHYYTHEEILGLIEFYKTPLGKAMIENTPLIQSDAMAVGQRWASEKTQEIMSRIMPTKGAAGDAAPPE
jgi:hypothetical protein